MSDKPEAGRSEGELSAIAREEAYLRELNAKPFFSRLAGYVTLSGPGWLQSALTLGGGSLSSSLYLGVLGGVALLWVQPIAMIMGIIMLSAIGYVTLSTGEKPFRAVNRHVSPILGWGWLLASLLANMVWVMPQYSLATGVLQQNLFPSVLGTDGMLDNSFGPYASRIAIAAGIFVACTIVTWSYGSGHWGIRLYELMLKLLVAGVVACFLGVVIKMAISEPDFSWTKIFAGLIPDLNMWNQPTQFFVDKYKGILEPDAWAYWSNRIVQDQRDFMISAAATAVGINMTFLLPYSLLSRGWSREFRGLLVFDLSTGMFIPYTIATSCVVIAASSQFHGKPLAGLVSGDESAVVSMATEAQKKDYQGLLIARMAAKGEDKAALGKLDSEQLYAKAKSVLPESERELAATLVKRDAFDLSQSLKPLAGEFVGNIIFGLGVLGMALSTVTLLMLVSGFVICEVFNVPTTGWTMRLGSLFAATGIIGSFTTDAAFALAIPTSVFAMTMLPIAYGTFFLMMNRPALLKEAMPRGFNRVVINGLLLLATGIATVASLAVIGNKAGIAGYCLFGFFAAAFLWALVRPSKVES